MFCLHIHGASEPLGSPFVDWFFCMVCRFLVTTLPFQDHERISISVLCFHIGIRIGRPFAAQSVSTGQNSRNSTCQIDFFLGPNSCTFFETF